MSDMKQCTSGLHGLRAVIHISIKVDILNYHKGNSLLHDYNSTRFVVVSLLSLGGKTDFTWNPHM
jgi:hypothetical protein